MALIICPECGKQFSNKATACPQCACPVNKVEPNDNSTRMKVNLTEVRASSGNTESVSNKRQKLSPGQIIFFMLFAFLTAGIISADHEKHKFRIAMYTYFGDVASHVSDRDIDSAWESEIGNRSLFTTVSMLSFPAILFFCLGMSTYAYPKNGFVKGFGGIIGTMIIITISEVLRYHFPPLEVTVFTILFYIFGGYCFTHLFYIIENKILEFKPS